MSAPKGKFVCFRSSFRCDGSRGGEETPNISHAVLDGAERTLCGRANWETNEGKFKGRDADCLRCDRALRALRRAARSCCDEYDVCVVDNQGLCHNCGKLLDRMLWEAYAGKDAPAP